MKRLRILLVDDDTSFLLAAAGMLRDGGAEVTTAETPERAMAAVEAGPYDLAVIDICLSVSGSREGLEVARALRLANERTRVIIITAHADHDCRARAGLVGANLFLEKPVSIERVEEEIFALVDRGETSEEGEQW